MNTAVRRTLLIACIAALASACSPASSTSSPASPASAGTPTATPAPTATAVAPAPLTIGILVPFTESAINSELGVAQQRAAELYLKQQGGKLAGRDVSLVYSDESITGSLDVVKAKQLVETEGADVLLGLIGNDGAYAVRTYADGKHVVFIDTNASGNALTRDVAGCTPSCKSPYLFRSSYSSWQLSEPLGEWAAKKGETKFYVTASSDTFGAESAAAFVEGLTKQGGTATATAAVPAGTDWGKVIAVIAAQPTKAVFAAFALSDAEGFIGAWDAAHLSDKGYKVFGPGPLTEVAVLAKVKAAAAGVTTASFWATTLDNPQNTALMALFAKTYKDESGNPVTADSYVVQMWDAMTALDQALQKTGGSTAGDALVAALAGVSFNSPRGAFAFDPSTHNVVQDIYIREVRATGVSVSNAVIDTIPKVGDPGK
jgi:branched-chain amino acid transport system substrate-binding protein